MENIANIEWSKKTVTLKNKSNVEIKYKIKLDIGCDNSFFLFEAKNLTPEISEEEMIKKFVIKKSSIKLVEGKYIFNIKYNDDYDFCNKNPDYVPYFNK